MEKDIHFKYLIANEQDQKWGLTVNSTGYQSIGVNAPYPPGDHPVRYLFSPRQGRILQEYQLLYLVRGKGRFASEHQKPVDIKEGNMILLFPGEWHTYYPDKKTGWDEYWIGFNGINMDSRIENVFFNKEQPIFNTGIREDIVLLYKKSIEMAQTQPTGFQQMLAGIVNYILGYTYTAHKQSSFEELNVSNAINKAKLIMAENLSTKISLEDIAATVCMSYSWFRRIFKQYTGFTPAQYIRTVRIQKSKELLTHSLLSVQEITFQIGFDNPEHFGTLFRKETGMTPLQYRRFTQGKELGNIL